MKNRILEIFQAAGRSLSLHEVGERLASGRKHRQKIAGELESLVAQGRLVLLRNRRYALPREGDVTIGRLSLHRDGYGFVVPEQGGDNDVYVAARDLDGAMQGDRVEVMVNRGPQRGDRRQGRIVKVLERASSQILGIFRQGRHAGRIHPVDRNRGLPVEVPPGSFGQARAGEVVLADIEQYPRDGRPARARIVEVFGPPDDPQVEVRMVAHRFGLPQEFSAPALQQAEVTPEQIGSGDLQGRRDLRDLPLVTIDGETAKDFDDAVALVRERGGYRLWVAIADVAHYVHAGSPLDGDARERGTSVYFPGICLPMFPERISNGICSLNPAEDRLVMVAELQFDASGARIESSFYPAVIHSRARLTYTRVQSFLDDAAVPEVADRRAVEQLRPMAELTKLLADRRQRRGSLDFDLPEAVIDLDDGGRVVGIRKAERLFAHRLIEEFMLAANEAVATFLEQRGQPLLFRVHEPPNPQKLEAFQQFVAHFNHGLVLGKPAELAADLQRLLAEVNGTAEEQAINQTLLRSMKQAYYSVENLEHFGLAASSYCHFTSPIRRYPDLLVHRALKQLLATGKAAENPELAELGDEMSRKERRAMDAERDLVALKKCRYMQGRIGEGFAAHVSGVQPFGLFVELDEIFVEGLIHIAALQDDYYHFEEDLQRLVGYNRRRIFQIGAPLRVRLVRVDLDGREIDFELDEVVAAPSRKRRKGHVKK